MRRRPAKFRNPTRNLAVTHRRWVAEKYWTAPSPKAGYNSPCASACLHGTGPSSCSSCSSCPRSCRSSKLKSAFSQTVAWKRTLWTGLSAGQWGGSNCVHTLSLTAPMSYFQITTNLSVLPSTRAGRSMSYVATSPPKPFNFRTPRVCDLVILRQKAAEQTAPTTENATNAPKFVMSPASADTGSGFLDGTLMLVDVVKAATSACRRALAVTTVTSRFCGEAASPGGNRRRLEAAAPKPSRRSLRIASRVGSGPDGGRPKTNSARTTSAGTGGVGMRRSGTTCMLTQVTLWRPMSAVVRENASATRSRSEADHVCTNMAGSVTASSSTYLPNLALVVADVLPLFVIAGRTTALGTVVVA
mmetsp:Transcript_69830/g.202606  ORF Transcript_69830/g.202606 Transcript_69830/m.202606 type:complete len:359 (-) Transcript_69830:145-1221(-)